MAYQTYITEAIVCGSSDSNTSNRSFLLFTRDAGMVYAHAQSVREERSKHRFAMQECGHVRVTLVRGKAGWRVIGAESLGNFYTNAQSREARAFVRNVLLLVRRFLLGETPHEGIFDEVVFSCTQLDVYIPSKLEFVMSLRILHSLGYIGESEDTHYLIAEPITELAIDAVTEEVEKKGKSLIAKALTESHL